MISVNIFRTFLGPWSASEYETFIEVLQTEKLFNVIETRLVLYAPLYVEKQAIYWFSLGEGFHPATRHFVS